MTEESFSFTRLEAEEPVDVVDGEEVKFSAGDSILVVCSVTKVYPTPTLKLTLGGEEIQDAALEENKEDSDYQVVDQQLGVVEQWVTVSKTFRTRVTYEMAGKSLSCSGMLPGRSGTARGFTIGMDASEYSLIIMFMYMLTPGGYSRPALTMGQCAYKRHCNRCQSKL